MKNQRQNLIMQIVKDENIGTQEELREALKRHGLKVTQATVSRDIKELSLVKTIGSIINTACLHSKKILQSKTTVFSA